MPRAKVCEAIASRVSFAGFRAGLIPAEDRIGEPLFGAPRRYVRLACFGASSEAWPETFRQGGGTISLHGQSAAFLRPVECEGRHDDRCPRCRGGRQLLAIADKVLDQPLDGHP